MPAAYAATGASAIGELLNCLSARSYILELAKTLRRITGGRVEKETAGAWVLTQLEARRLCAGAFNSAQCGRAQVAG